MSTSIAQHSTVQSSPHLPIYLSIYLSIRLSIQTLLLLTLSPLFFPLLPLLPLLPLFAVPPKHISNVREWSLDLGLDLKLNTK